MGRKAPLQTNTPRHQQQRITNEVNPFLTNAFGASIVILRGNRSDFEFYFIFEEIPLKQTDGTPHSSYV